MDDFALPDNGMVDSGMLDDDDDSFDGVQNAFRLGSLHINNEPAQLAVVCQDLAVAHDESPNNDGNTMHDPDENAKPADETEGKHDGISEIASKANSFPVVTTTPPIVSTGVPGQQSDQHCSYEFDAGKGWCYFHHDAEVSPIYRNNDTALTHDICMKCFEEFGKECDHSNKASFTERKKNIKLMSRTNFKQCSACGLNQPLRSGIYYCDSCDLHRVCKGCFVSGKLLGPRSNRNDKTPTGDHAAAVSALNTEITPNRPRRAASINHKVIRNNDKRARMSN